MGLALERARLSLEQGRADPAVLAEGKRIAVELSECVHRLIHDLRPPVLDDLGLESALRWLLERHLTPSGVKWDIQLAGRVPSGQNAAFKRLELTVFRIVQEAVVNIARHARARRVALRLDCEQSKIRLKIEDDGAGFDPTGGSGGGFGLAGLRERVALLDGSMEIASRPGKGTRLDVVIPLAGLAEGDDA